MGAIVKITDILRSHPRRSLAATTVAIVIIGGAAATASLASASTSSTSTLIACANHKGSLRLVSNATDCHEDETAVQWNVVGPPGPPGASGPRGATGAVGPAGPTGAAGAGATPSTPNSEVVGTLTFTPQTGASAGTPLTVNLYSFSSSIDQTLGIGSQSSGAGAGKVTFNPATMTIPIGDASLALTDSLYSANPLNSASIVLFAPQSTTPVETIDLTLVAVKNVTTSNDGAPSSSPLVAVSIEFGAVQFTLPSGQSTS